MQMTVMAPNKSWSDLTTKEKAPFLLRSRPVRVALIGARRHRRS
jgi:hypothetical protein